MERTDIIKLFSLPTRLNAVIDMKQLEKERIMESALSVTAKADGMPHSNGGHGDKVGNAVTNAADLEAEIDALIDAFADLKRDLADLAQETLPAAQYRVAMLNLVHGMPLTTVAEECHYTYQWVSELKKRALDTMADTETAAAIYAKYIGFFEKS